MAPSTPRAADRSVRRLLARACDELPGPVGQATAARGSRSGLHGLLQPGDRPFARGAPSTAREVRAALRDAARPPGAGRLRPVPGRVRRRARRRARGLAVLARARAQPVALGALLCRAGPSDRHALPHRRLRRDGRRAFRVALRADEDRGDRRGCRRGGELQRLAGGAPEPLRRDPPRLPPVPRQDQGQGGAVLPLRPPGLLPRALLRSPWASDRWRLHGSPWPTSTASSTTGGARSPTPASTPPRALAIVLGPMADDGSPWPSTSPRSSRL